MTSAPAEKRIAVVGGGLAGLVAAYEVTRHSGFTPVLFEAGARLGGTVETVHANGFTIETGPDSWVSDRPAARELAEELGLGGELIRSNDAERRTYLVQDGTLTPMPDGMRMMVPTRWEPVLHSPLFSEAARLAYLSEPERAAELKAEAAGRLPDFDESVRAFVTRHFGEEATQTIAGPLLAGVFGGSIDTLSAGAVLAPFVRLEQEHGSLIAPIMARVEADRLAGREPEAVFTTLRPGLQTLVDRLIATLPFDYARLRTPVMSIAREGESWIVSSDAHGPERFDAVVLATPAHRTRTLVTPVDAQAAELLAMDATSAVVVALCYSPEDSARIEIPRGFGFLVPPQHVHPLPVQEEPELLAGTFMHQKFPHRAPDGAVFLRGFFGGADAPRMMEWPDARISEAGRRAFAKLLGPLPPAQHAVVRRWPHSLPQYSVGHPARMRRLFEHIRNLPGLALTGNAYGGVGLPALVQHARQGVRELLAAGL